MVLNITRNLTRTRFSPLSLPKFYSTTSNKSDFILFEEKNNVGIVTLNRPKALNALSVDMSKKLKAQLQSWEDRIKLVILKGAGGRAFCCGGDVREVFSGAGTDTFKFAYQCFPIIKNYPKPVVALMDGVTMGAGMGLAMNSKYRVATENTLCAMPETAIGLIPDASGTFFLSRLKGKLGVYLGMTGHRLKGENVVKGGLGTHFIPSENLEQFESEILNNDGSENSLTATLDKFSKLSDEPFVLEEHMTAINDCFSQKSVEEIFKKLEEYIAEDNDWARTALWSLKKNSPTSIKVTKRLHELGSGLDIYQCLQLEFRVITRMFEYGDFREGCRAKLFDKDHEPKWSPATIEEVQDDYVETFFGKMLEEKELKFS